MYGNTQFPHQAGISVKHVHSNATELAFFSKVTVLALQA